MDSRGCRRGSHDFAARMMAKWGHKAGQGLGADASGIVEPLTVRKAPAAKSKGTNQPAAVGGIGIKEGAKVAKIINKYDDYSERIRFGDPSTIVVLTNMVGLDDVEDEDLRDEIGKFFRVHMT
jgi:splicing factor 45